MFQRLTGSPDLRDSGPDKQLLLFKFPLKASVFSPQDPLPDLESEPCKSASHPLEVIPL